MVRYRQSEVIQLESYQRLKYLRKEILKLSQETLGKKLNLSRSNLANIEAGRINLTDRVIKDLCKNLSVNENWILSGDEPIFIDSHDPLINQIIEIFKTLNDDNRKYLQGYATRLLEEQKPN